MKYIAVAAALAGAAVADNLWAPVVHTTTTTKPKPVDPATTWSALPVDPATTWATYVKPTTTTKKGCSYVTEVPIKKCRPAIPGQPEKCHVFKSKTTYYADECTWNNYVDPVTKTIYETETWSDVDVYVTATDSCTVNVVTSYGAPTWNPVPEATTSVAPAPATQTWAPVRLSGTPDVPSSDKGHAPIAPNGNKWSMTYTPYDAKGKCKTEEVIKKDIASLASRGFVSVRVYSTKCETLKFIGDACRANGVKIILGVYVDKTGVNGDYVKEQVKAISEWKQWDLVELIVIGNESIFQGFCKAEDLVWLIQDSKAKFAAAGYTGPCSTTEPLASWQTDGAKFCKVVDVVSANLYAYFNADTTCDKAGEFIQAEIDILTKICVGKEVYVLESGWPSAGNCNGKACPGKEEQKKAIKSIHDTCGAKIVFFSFEDELWKEAGQYNVEQHWGCADVFEPTWKPVTVTSTTAAATSTWAGWTTSTTAPVNPATSTWATY